MEFKNLSLLEIRDLIIAGKTNAEEVYLYFLERTRLYNEELNAFNTLPNDAFLAHTENETGAGLPIAVKDIFCEIGTRTTASSKMLADFIPPYESTVTDRMKKAGFVGFGKTNMDEYAMGGSGENSAFAPTRNPWDLSRVPGGSSSGSAAAVAAGLVPAALGTDTGGSIRQPASMCGIVGFKPGYGRNSRSGVIAMASSLDCPGYFTRTVRDAGLLYETTRIGSDRFNITHGARNHRPKNLGSKRSYRYKSRSTTGVLIDGIDAGVRQEIEGALAKVRDMGAEIIDISLPHTEYGISVYYIICPAEVSSNMGRYDGIRYGHIAEGDFSIAKNRAEGLGSEVQRRSMIGSFVLSSGFYDAYYKRASDVRELIREDFRKAFEQVDVILTPTAPNVAWKIGEKGDDPLKLYLEDVFTVPASLAGLPGLTLPVGFAHPDDDTNVELPVGMQILGPTLGEERVLEVANVIENALKEKIQSKTPKIW